MRKICSVIVFTMLIVVTASAQMAMSHQHSSAQVVNGATHPELIPDLTAYRLYFLMVSNAPDATENEQARHARQLHKVPLNSVDNQSVATILADFKAQYHLLVASFNEEAREADTKGEHPDLQSFLSKRDHLVQATQKNLKQTLSPDGWNLLDAHIRSEKRRMQINTDGGVQ